MAKRIKSAFEQATGRVNLESGDRPGRTVGVALTGEQKETLEAIAAELGISRHKVMQLAIEKFLADWGGGWRPTRETRKVTEYKI